MIGFRPELHFKEESRMSRPIRRGLSFLAVAVLVGAIFLTLVSTRAASKDEERTGPGVIIEATPEILPVGRNCRITMRPDPQAPKTTVRMLYHGKIVETNSEGLSLDVLEVRREETASSRLSRLPVVNRLFRNVGIGRPAPNGKPTWISADKIQLVQLEPPAAIQPPPITP